MYEIVIGQVSEGLAMIGPIAADSHNPVCEVLEIVTVPPPSQQDIALERMIFTYILYACVCGGRGRDSNVH